MSIITLNKIQEPITIELERVNLLLQKQSKAKLPIIEQVVKYAMQRGGKQLRPLVMLLLTKALGYQGEETYSLAACLELIHTASLLHDDVIDESEKRRGQISAHKKWGNATCILVGDYLYSRAFQLLISCEHHPVLKVYAKATNVVSQGEIKQLSQRYNPYITETDYLEVIKAKTGKLFEVAAHIPPILANSGNKQEKNLKAFGMHLGTAFQIIDDLLDYEIDAKQLGKNPGDDLADGNATLPIIYAMENTSKEEASIIKNAIINGDSSKLDLIRNLVKKSGAIKYALDVVTKELNSAKLALQILPESKYKKALLELTEFALLRKY